MILAGALSRTNTAFDLKIFKSKQKFKKFVHFKKTSELWHKKICQNYFRLSAAVMKFS
jgi:hypothetical protein